MTEDLKLWSVARGRIKGSVTKLRTWMSVIPSTTTLAEIKARCQNLGELEKDFIKYDDLITSVEETGYKSDYDQFEETIAEIKAIMYDEIEKRTPGGSKKSDSEDNDKFSELLKAFTENQKLLLDQSSIKSSSTYLSKLNIKKFNGDYKEWPTFKDQFIKLIHNDKTLSDIFKFSKLKELLGPEPLKLIESMIVSEVNYKNAWEKLQKRFDNKRKIAIAYLDAFFNQKQVRDGSVEEIRAITDNCESILMGLDSIHDDAKNRDIWLIHIILNKLDDKTKKLWAEKTTELFKDVDENQKVFPTIAEFFEFLHDQRETLENQNIKKKVQPTSVKSNFYVSKSVCPKCKLPHPLYKCYKFKALPVKDRKLFVEKSSVCFKCLGSGHFSKNCTYQIKCRTCKKNHHELIHLEKSEVNFVNNNDNSQESLNAAEGGISSGGQQSYFAAPFISSSLNNRCLEENIKYEEQLGSKCNSFSASCNMVSSGISLLPTAQVGVSRPEENMMIKCNILLDSGSHLSFITESLVQKLQLERENSKINLTGLSSLNVGTTKGVVTVKLSSLHDGAEIIIQAHILSQISSKLPAKYVRISDRAHLRSKKLADENFNCPKKVDILIGAQYFFEVLRQGEVGATQGCPALHNSIFGWLVAGSFNGAESNAQIFTSRSDDCENVDYTLQQFWEIEEIPNDNVDSFTNEEVFCESHFQESVKVNDKGKFVVKLPFRKESKDLGDSLHSAQSRFYSLERRLKYNGELYDQYRSFMKSYFEMGHMELVPKNEIAIDNKNSYYLVHHPVIKPDSLTTKCRVVFDGSNKTSSGVSLNDKLAVGPTIQRDLLSILICSRQYKVALCGDVEKMYRQVVVNKQDCDFQRILWRETSDSQLLHFRLSTVTYGTSSAPYLATRALKEIGMRCKESHPEASKVIINDFYVDDLITGAKNVTDAIKLQKDIAMILQQYGFPLRKWLSNIPEVLDSIFDENIENLLIKIYDNENSVKVLGLCWQPNEDYFTFKVNVKNDIICTKRNILSESAKIFDPMGFLSPCTISAKILFQKLWLNKFEWDEVLPPDIQEKWLNLRGSFKDFEKIKIARWVFTGDENFEVIGFCDASEAAYSAVVYIKTTDEEGNKRISFLTSKTKVAPLKQTSIPRLELCGALLLSKLLKFVTSSLNLQNQKITAFTASSIVLSWLASHPKRWKPYVSNRTALILEKVPTANWKYIQSKQNPADCASRGISPKDLVNNILWWHGPSWLVEDSSHWPKSILNSDGDLVEKEARKKVVSVFHVVQETNQVLEGLFAKVSSLSKILRILSYCQRFFKSRKNESFITCAELNSSLEICIKWAQFQEYSSEMKLLIHSKIISNRSKLASLNPFIDIQGILRVKGRLENSAVDYNAKHPVIIPKGHILGYLIIQELHCKHLHAGPSLLINIIRQRYWIIGCRNMVRKSIRNCIVCTRFSAQIGRQLMGELPTPRVTPSSIFQEIGIDYAGPFSVKWNKGRNPKTSKGYLCIFVCLSSKAVHLELVSDMTSEAFIFTLKRMISRRGVPSTIYSDNGLNFIGAKKHISLLYHAAFENKRRVGEYLAENSIQWKMIPPIAPHFGGIWESSVKSTKFHLKRVIGKQVLTFEELATLFAQIEAQLNSRPLTPLYENDLSNLDVLTPGHFIIQRPLVAIPDKNLLNVKVPVRDRWSLVTQIQQSFWKRWQRDYLNNLQQRKKWRFQQENFKVGQIVLLKDENHPPLSWPLGRIIELHSGQDNCVRVVTVKTANNIFKRPITKLIKLPVDDSG